MRHRALESARRLADQQDLVVTTRQCVELGIDADWVARRVAAGEWQRLHRGVVVVHSGPIGWRSRARGALLVSGAGATLSHTSAGYLHNVLPEAPQRIDVSVPAHRRTSPTAGVRVRRRRSLEPVLTSRLPTTSRGDTVADLLALARSEDDAVGLICAAVRARIPPEEILEALARRQRAPRRRLALMLLSAVDAGIESPLELRYHRDVEGRHGLPPALRQHTSQVGGRWIRADCVYLGLGVRVELDGALAHPGGRTDADTWRDNAVLLDVRDLTLRYRWWHVAVTPCATAVQVVSALRINGWSGTPRTCSPTCPVR